MTPTRKGLHPAVVLTLVSVGYAVMAFVAQEAIYNHNYVCALWPAAGVGLVAVVRWGWLGAIGVWTGSVTGILFFFRGDLTGWPLVGMAMATGGGAAAEASIAAVVLKRLLGGEKKLLKRFRVQFFFTPAMWVCSTVSAFIGVTTNLWVGRLTEGQWLEGFWLWSIGDTLGMLLVAPFLFSCLRQQDRPIRTMAKWTIFASLVSTTALACLFFASRYPLANLLVLPILLFCFYTRQRWTLLSALSVALVATAATTRGFGPFHAENNTLTTQLNLYPFIFVLGVIGLTVSARIRRETRNARAAAEQRNQNITLLAPVGIFYTDETGQTTYINPEARESMGMDPAEPAHRWQQHLAETDKSRVLSEWEDFVRQVRAAPAAESYQPAVIAEVFDVAGDIRHVEVPRQGQLDTCCSQPGLDRAGVRGQSLNTKFQSRISKDVGVVRQHHDAGGNQNHRLRGKVARLRSGREITSRSGRDAISVRAPLAPEDGGEGLGVRGFACPPPRTHLIPVEGFAPSPLTPLPRRRGRGEPENTRLSSGCYFSTAS